MGLPQDQIVDHMQFFVPWFVFNWMYDPGDAEVKLDVPPLQTVAEIYARERGQRLDKLQRRLIDETSGRPFSFFEVTSCQQGEGYRLKDIFRGIETDVIEKQGSENARPGDILLARIVQIDHVAMLVGCGSILITPNFKPAIIDLRREMLQEYRHITTDVLIDYDIEIRELYFDIYESVLQPPQLCNTDGDPLLFHILHYDINDAEKAFQRLCSLSAVEDEKTLRTSATIDDKGRVIKAEIPWSREGHKASSALDNTVLGRIAISNRKLTIEVNSEARAKVVRKEVETRLGKSAMYKTTEIQSPESIPAKEKIAKGRTLEKKMGHDEMMQIPEVRDKMAKVLTAHWEDWINQKIPALGGITPREAVKNPDGRESVEALLLDAERHMTDDEQMGSISLNAIKDTRRRLGLDKKQSATVKSPNMKKIAERMEAIESMIEDFGRIKLDNMHTGLAIKLCNRIARMRKLSIQRGRIEIWASAIVHVIARVNFLFDPENEISITADDVCKFFGTKKTTVSSKAGLIQKACDIYLGNKEYCTAEISDMFCIYETKEGFLVPGFMRDNLDESPPAEYKSRSTENVKKAAEKKDRRGNLGSKNKPSDIDGKKDSKRQLKLFDDF
ncbi:MAG: DUF2384 domain-containing protein [Deltaproteobacteria bacterium]|nr:DUF2384 domain-containing protein [Deltaproteobacteria bacterium]